MPFIRRHIVFVAYIIIMCVMDVETRVGTYDFVRYQLLIEQHIFNIICWSCIFMELNIILEQ